MHNTYRITAYSRMFVRLIYTCVTDWRMYFSKFGFMQLVLFQILYYQNMIIYTTPVKT